MLIYPQPGLEALHLSAFLSALLLLVGLLSSRRGLSCKPRPQDVHPQEVESAPWSLQNTRGTNSVTLRTALAGGVPRAGGLVLPRETKQLHQASQGAQKSKAVAGVQNKWPGFISWLRNVYSAQTSYMEIPASGLHYPEGSNSPDILPLLPSENTPPFL